MEYQKLLLDHLGLVDRIVAFIARRHHLSASDTEEFASVVRYKLIDRNFAILRKFKQRSNLSTYLTTVIERMYLDFCIARWGKWRPSAAARRLGGVALLLEQLVARDGLTFDEAVGTLQTNHAIPSTRAELYALLVQLPPRAGRKFVGEEEIDLLAMHESDERAFDRPDDQATVDRIEAALTDAVAELPPQDQLILKLRFQDNLPVPQIARVLSLEPKPLYRRLDHIIAACRERLGRANIDQPSIDRVIGHPSLTWGRIFDTRVDRVSRGGRRVASV